VRPEPLPLRPRTVGELLDAAVGQVRGIAPILLPVALLLSVLEQLALTPLRLAYFGDASPLPAFEDLFGKPWLVLAIGAGTETLIITLLGALTARSAAHATVGLHVTVGRLFSGTRLYLVVPVAIFAGTVTALMTLVAPGWLISYPALGMIMPVLVVDQLGFFRSIGRGLRLSIRISARAATIRLLGYVAWFLIRLGFGLGLSAALSTAGLGRFGEWPVVAAFTLINAFAYPVLAGLDAVVHVETRMRTEGLDIALNRSGRSAQLPVASLAVRR
jgi:hypothetical protein